MRHQVTIFKDNNILYEGYLIEIPIKEDILTAWSSDLFGDPDPCIIHQTYVREKLIDRFLKTFKKHLNETIILKNYPQEIAFIKIENIENCQMIIRRKK